MSNEVKQSSEMVQEPSIAIMGRFERNLDPKKRLTIPSRWRDALGPDYVYVMPDPARECLQLIPKAMMEARIAKLRSMPLSDGRLNALLDAIGENSETLDFDTAGRIRISDRLLAHAKVKGAVVLKGGMRIATLWSGDGSAAGGGVDAAKLGEALAALEL